VTVKRMDNVGIVVEDLDAAVAFFTELGLVLEGRMPIEGEWAGRVTGVRGQRVEIAMMRTPDGHGRLELSRFDAPARLRRLGATLVDEVVDYEGIYRLCYIRGPEGILIGLAQQLGRQPSRVDPMERRR
jgi:catechol 2,3-dioxygenase-like lactoylglutathione lyase family enzyme